MSDTKVNVSNADKDKFGKVIQDILTMAQKKGLSDWEFIDQIPDSEFEDEPIPFPYGGGRKNFNSIDSY